MADVVIKKSRIEIEKEAALRAQLAEKENQLKNINQKGLVMKFEIIEPRSSKSPPFGTKLKTNLPSKNK